MTSLRKLRLLIITSYILTEVLMRSLIRGLLTLPKVIATSMTPIVDPLIWDLSAGEKQPKINEKVACVIDILSALACSVMLWGGVKVAIAITAAKLLKAFGLTLMILCLGIFKASVGHVKTVVYDWYRQIIKREEELRKSSATIGQHEEVATENRPSCYPHHQPMGARTGQDHQWRNQAHLHNTRQDQLKRPGTVDWLNTVIKTLWCNYRSMLEESFLGEWQKIKDTASSYSGASQMLRYIDLLSLDLGDKPPILNSVEVYGDCDNLTVDINFAIYRFVQVCHKLLGLVKIINS